MKRSRPVDGKLSTNRDAAWLMLLRAQVNSFLGVFFGKRRCWQDNRGWSMFQSVCFQEKIRCLTEWYGLEGMVGMDGWLDTMISAVFPTLLVLCFYDRYYFCYCWVVIAPIVVSAAKLRWSKLGLTSSLTGSFSIMVFLHWMKTCFWCTKNGKGGRDSVTANDYSDVGTKPCLHISMENTSFWKHEGKQTESWDAVALKTENWIQKSLPCSILCKCNVFLSG